MCNVLDRRGRVAAPPERVLEGDSRLVRVIYKIHRAARTRTAASATRYNREYSRTIAVKRKQTERMHAPALDGFKKCVMTVLLPDCFGPQKSTNDSRPFSELESTDAAVAPPPGIYTCEKLCQLTVVSSDEQGTEYVGQVCSNQVARVADFAAHSVACTAYQQPNSTASGILNYLPS